MKKLSVLIITSRTSKRWIIPKGWMQPKLGASGSAAVEAWEEAGVLGICDKKKFGDFKNIKILKIEAEGGEPEILEGALKTLPKVEYITADLGYERGYKNEQTFTAFTNILMPKGFEMIDVFQDRLTVIFKNKFGHISSINGMVFI